MSYCQWYDEFHTLLFRCSAIRSRAALRRRKDRIWLIAGLDEAYLQFITHFVNKVISCQRNKDVEYISEVLDGLHRFYRISKHNIPVNFKHSNIYIIYMLVVIQFILTNTLYNHHGDENSPIINANGAHVDQTKSSVKLPKIHKMCNVGNFNVACFKTSGYA